MAPERRKKGEDPSPDQHRSSPYTMHTRKNRVASDNSMIRRNSSNCNILTNKKTTDFLYTYSEADIPDLADVNCPACRARGMFKNHGWYSRYVIDLRKGKPETYRIKIYRVKCDCGHTHALLKDTLIPYCQYSLRFILQVLKAYFRRSHTVSQICADFQIAPPTLYRWKRIFLEHRGLWLGLMKSLEQEPQAFLRFIGHLSIPSVFLSSFFRLTGFSFLQAHANPAYS